jgi:hypothetical protein
VATTVTSAASARRRRSSSQSDRSLEFAWLPSVPQGAVTITCSVGGEQDETTGVGYHDHNWGNVGLMKVVHDWYWARGQAGPYSVIASCITAAKKYGFEAIPIFMLARDGRQRVPAGHRRAVSRAGISGYLPPVVVVPARHAASRRQRSAAAGRAPVVPASAARCKAAPPASPAGGAGPSADAPPATVPRDLLRGAGRAWLFELRPTASPAASIVLSSQGAVARAGYRGLRRP